MKDKIYITNLWHSRNNYGANLTAFALQSIIEKLGYKSELVNNTTKMREYKWRKSTFSFKFAKKYLKHTSFMKGCLDILNIYGNVFITGSDQVFRPKYTHEKLDHYLLDFVNVDNKKIAFSASFGVDKEQFINENSDDIIKHMAKSLKSFDFLSVREKSGVEICKDLFDVDAQWIIDPVFVLDKTVYDKLIQNSTENYNNSIVSYVLDTTDDYKKAFKYLSKKYNIDVINTANSNISIENWLASIKNCRLFITDSFHGMCFAIIFNKPFICISNRKRGGARFDSICEMLGIENQCIDSIEQIYDNDCVCKIDYESVNKRIQEEAQKGIEFLSNALNAPVKITQEKIDAKITYLENQVLELEKRDNLKYQLKKYIWDNWLIIYNYYLPKPIMYIIRIFWRILKGIRNACRK